jgi:DNA-binding LacI/PurR family transcriptional regulator
VDKGQLKAEEVRISPVPPLEAPSGMRARATPRPSGHPTIADVAKLAGVSRSTVSNVLNGHHKRLSAATAARVEQASKALGFVPDEVARQLRRGHAKTIGLLIPSVANPFWGEFVRAIEEAARVLDHSVLAASTDRDPAREQSYSEAMYRQGVRALIFGSSLVSMTHVSSLLERNLHVLVFDRRFRNGDIDAVDCVSVNNGLGGRLATEALVSLGHRRIGFLSGPIKTASRRDRFAGYKRALRAAGIEFDSARVWAGSGKSAFGDPEAGELGRLGARALLTNGSGVTAIVAVNDMYALGAYAGIRSVGLSVPNDVSVIGFDDIALTTLVEPPLSTIRQPVWEMAETAVRRLVAALDDDASDVPLRAEFAPELVMRGSAAPVQLQMVPTDGRKPAGGKKTGEGNTDEGLSVRSRRGDSSKTNGRRAGARTKPEQLAERAHNG